MGADFRQALRRLLGAPGFSLTVIAILALGIGATTAIFSVCYGVLLKPMPYADSERLVFILESEPQVPEMSLAYPNYIDYKTQSQSFEELGVYNRASYNITGDGDPERVQAGQVSASLFRAMRTTPALGRYFTDEEDRPGAERVVVLGQGVWQRRFGADPGILGRKVQLNDQPYTVIGVMPLEFRMPTRVEMWVPVGPLSADPSWQSRGNHPGLFAVARLKDGVSIEAARADLLRVSKDLAKAYSENSLTTTVLSPLLEIYVSDIRRTLQVLLAAVTLVLLIGCANVASLMLVRLTARQKELAVRRALGASMAQLVRNTLAETAFLGLAGGILGVLIAKGALIALIPLASGLPRTQEIAIDGRVLSVAIVLSILSSLIVGLFPALQFRSGRIQNALLQEGRGFTGGRARARAALVVGEVALTVVLLVGAGLVIRSFGRLLDVAPGFDTEKTLTFAVSLPGARYQTPESRGAFFEALEERLSSLPGVERVAVSTGLPLGLNGWQSGFYVEGRGDPNKPGSWTSMEFMIVSPSYFETLGMKMVAGRPFDKLLRTQHLSGPEFAGLTGDNRLLARVNSLVIDADFARTIWPGDKAVGKHVRWSMDPRVPPLEVIGVVGRVRMDGIDQETRRVQAYASMLQRPAGEMRLTLKTVLPPASLLPAVREALRQLDPAQPLFDVRTLADVRNESLGPARLSMTLLSLFALVALALALIGIFGVMSYTVAQQTREIGVRLALGADPSEVVSLVVGQGVRLAVTGAVIGGLAATALAGLMRGLLYEVNPHDPPTFAFALGVLLIAALLAAYLPARRAASVDPIAALRAE